MRAPAPFSSKLRFPLYSARFLPTPFSATHLLLWPVSKTEAGNTRVGVAPGESPLFPATALVACVASGSAGWAVPAESARAGQGGAGSYLLLSIPGDVVQGKSAIPSFPSSSTSRRLLFWETVSSIQAFTCLSFKLWPLEGECFSPTSPAHHRFIHQSQMQS